MTTSWTIGTPQSPCHQTPLDMPAWHCTHHFHHHPCHCHNECPIARPRSKHPSFSQRHDAEDASDTETEYIFKRPNPVVEYTPPKYTPPTVSSADVHAREVWVPAGPGYLIIRQNSHPKGCLFTAAAQLLHDATPDTLRQTIARTVRDSSDMYPSNFYEFPAQVYLAWLRRPDAFGTSADLVLVAHAYSVEVVVVDMDKEHGFLRNYDKKPGEGHSQRILLVKSGDFYHPVALTLHPTQSKRHDETRFPATEDTYLDALVRLSKALAMVSSISSG
ncbi:ubiquitin-specific protease otu1 [Dimargaris xerosporica]|nr:ubiquitin-specific protease otu1 [Dimargaris xerosporica]